MRVGLVSFAHTHALTYAALLRDRGDIELLVADPGPHAADELRGDALARSLGLPAPLDVRTLLAARPDAVIVTAENARHRELVELAAAAGAAVLCEKPLATTWSDGLAIRDAVRRAGTALMVAFPVRFAPAFQTLLGQRDALGDLVSVRGANNGRLPVERSWFTDPALSGGGALADHVVHVADLVDALGGTRPARVTAVANRVLHADRARAETAGLVTVEYEDGPVLTVDCSWSVADRAPVWGGLTLAVTGTGGTADLDLFGPAVRGLDAATGLPRELRYGPDLDARMLDAFLGSVGTGVAPVPGVDAGLRTLSIVLAAQESVRTGRSVRADEVAPGAP